MNEQTAMLTILEAARVGRLAAQRGKRCNVARFVKSLQLPNLTVADLVAWCYELGYQTGKSTSPETLAFYAELEAAYAEAEARPHLQVLPGGKPP
jgi:hypothetical protein